MGKEKAGHLTPKAIGNRIKAKGLQKLRWFCQMCQKQCRDENGFKCHTSSESHQRQLLLFADNPNKFIDTFSKEFQDDFLKLVKRRCGTKRINANQIYQEYVSDRLHTHMNATQWETLTEFVKWLGKEGLCTVDQTEKGWFITYIDRDPEALERQKALEAKEKMDLDDADRQAKLLQKQIDRELSRKKDEPDSVFTELQREDEEEKVTFSLGGTKRDDRPGPSGLPVQSTSSLSATEGGTRNPLEAAAASAAKDKTKDKQTEKDSRHKDKESRKRKSAIQEIIEMENNKKEKISKKDYWLSKGIVVKVVYKKLGEKYYKKKGVVMSVENRYVSMVKMLDSGDVVKIDQQHLETVIPAIGKTVLILNGLHRGTAAKMISVNERSFSVSVELKDGPQKGRTIDKIPYEDISKLDI